MLEQPGMFREKFFQKMNNWKSTLTHYTVKFVLKMIDRSAKKYQHLRAEL